MDGGGSKVLKGRIPRVSKMWKGSKVVDIYLQIASKLYKLSQRVQMISSELMDHVAEIRRTDNNACGQPNSFFPTDGLQYFEQLQLLLEESERLQFKNTTKYLAKKYFDIFLSKHQDFVGQNSILVIITCLRSAAKFNETVEVSELYTLEYCIQQSNGQYERESFVQCEIELLKVLGFKMRMTSPYQFVVVKCLMPHLKQAMSILNSIIDFALSLPELRAASAQGIFFGALIYSCRAKNQPQLSYSIIHAITCKWEEAIQIAGTLEENLKRLLQE